MTMKNMTKAIVCMAAIIAAPLALACDYPARPPQAPDGTTATKEEMLAGVKVISDYQASMSRYLTCIEADDVVANIAVNNSDEETKQQRLKMFNMKYDAAIDEQSLVVEKFNVQVRAYKARNR